MSADAWLARINELERRGSIDYEYGPEARRLIAEYGAAACASHGGAEAVIDVAIRQTTLRSLAELCLDVPDNVKAIDQAGRKLVMQAARLRVKENGTLRPLAPPLPAVASVAVASVAQSARPREPRARRARTSSRASPDDPDPPRRCEYCGRPLVGRRPQTKTCSGSCRVLLHRRRQRAKAGA